MAEPIPFNKPSLEGRELELVQAAVEGGHTSAAGPFSQRAAAIVEAHLGAPLVLLTTSCTAALELSAMLLDIQPGEKVIVPSFTYVTSASAFVRAGAEIVFADIEPDTLGVDPEHVEHLLDDSVRAVVAVHYAGVACQIDPLQSMLAPRGIDLIEDAAQALFATLDDRPLGSIGRFGAFSFHETKNVTCGEGGALVVNDPNDVADAHVLFHKGTNRVAFDLGEVDRYTWMQTGSSFGLSDTLAAFLLGQLEVGDSILAKRRAAYERYDAALRPQAEQLGFRTPVVPPGATPAYHMYYVLLDDPDDRPRVLSALREDGVNAIFHYVPLHSSPAGRRHSTGQPHLPVTDSVSARLVRLPLFTSITSDEVDRVTESFLKAMAGRG